MIRKPLPSCLNAYYPDSFNLKQHLKEFLHCDLETLENRLTIGQQQMTELGHKDFNWEEVTVFYRDQVRELYLFELGSWHLDSFEYIEDTMLLVSDHAQGRVLDFGGGIGTHTIGAAICPDVDQVVYCDINPINLEFAKYRVEQMGLTQKIVFCSELPSNEIFDTIISFDVLEHLPDPEQQLLKFHQYLTNRGKTILNWRFFKGFHQEHPFHLDDPQLVDAFYRTLQSKFLEIFHPYLITARCYCKWT